ncbi:MAG: hypothetical protein WBI17_12980 [Clostridiaceae bacterium]
MLTKNISKKMKIPWLPCSKKSKILGPATDDAAPADAGRRKKNRLGIMGNIKIINPFQEKPKEFCKL